MHTTMDNELEIISAKLNTQVKEDSLFKGKDPFEKNWDQLKGLSGMDQNFRRRTIRNMSKAINPTPEDTAYLSAEIGRAHV